MKVALGKDLLMIFDLSGCRALYFRNYDRKNHHPPTVVATCIKFIITSKVFDSLCSATTLSDDHEKFF